MMRSPLTAHSAIEMIWHVYRDGLLVITFECRACELCLCVSGRPHDAVNEVATLVRLWHEGKLIAEGG